MSGKLVSGQTRRDLLDYWTLLEYVCEMVPRKLNG